MYVTKSWPFFTESELAPPSVSSRSWLHLPRSRKTRAASQERAGKEMLAVRLEIFIFLLFHMLHAVRKLEHCSRQREQNIAASIKLNVYNVLKSELNNTLVYVTEHNTSISSLCLQSHSMPHAASILGPGSRSKLNLLFCLQGMFVALS